MYYFYHTIVPITCYFVSILGIFHGILYIFHRLSARPVKFLTTILNVSRHLKGVRLLHVLLYYIFCVHIWLFPKMLGYESWNEIQLNNYHLELLSLLCFYGCQSECAYFYVPSFSPVSALSWVTFCPGGEHLCSISSGIYYILATGTRRTLRFDACMKVAPSWRTYPDRLLKPICHIQRKSENLHTSLLILYI